MVGIGMPELVILSMVVIFVVPFWKIFEKAGHPPVLSLLLIFPIVGLIVLFWFAFSEWPLEKKLNEKN